MSFVEDKNRIRLFGFFLFVSFIIGFVFLINSITEEKHPDFIKPEQKQNDTLFTLYSKPRDYIFEVRAINDNDTSNVSLRINQSHIKEIKESNGLLIIEIRK